MSYKVLAIPHFNRVLKRLANKYPSLKKEVAQLYIELKTDPKKGISIGAGCYTDPR